MSVFYNKKLISGVRDVPKMTLAEYNALTNKPKLWLRTDAPESDRGISANDVEYSTGVSVEDKIDTISSYSTTEKVVGTWINGKPLYQSIVSCGALPNNTTKVTAHGITGISKVVDITGYAFNGNDSIPIPYFNAQNANVKVGLYANASNIIINSGSVDMSSYSESYVTLRYTKTTD